MIVKKALPSLVAALMTSGLVGLVIAAGQEPVAVQAVPLPQTTHTAVQRAEQINRGEERSQLSDSGSEKPADAAAATVGKSPSATVSPSATTSATKHLVMPIAGGQPSSPFGMRLHPVTRVWKLHTGQDWAAPCGTPVGAAAEGVVTSVGWAGAYGLQIKISHGKLDGYDVVTTYNHLSATAVTVGQKVTPLQAIGSVGTTGYSTGCHLHFEVIADGKFSDPMPWINGGPVTIDTSQAKMVAPTSPDPVAGTTPSADEKYFFPGEPTSSPSASTTPSTPTTPITTQAPVTTVAPATPTPTKPVTTPPASPTPSPSPSPSASPSPTPSAAATKPAEPSSSAPVPDPRPAPGSPTTQPSS